MALVVNFFGGPSAGKSTIAAHVFAELKWEGFNTELVTEYAKDKVWENSLEVLDNQLYVFGKQQHKIQRVAKHVDILITDSPILNSLVYDKSKLPAFRKLVLYKHNEFDTLNFFITRNKPYSSIGRMQTEAGAKDLDEEIFNMLQEEKIKFTVIGGFRESVATIVKTIINTI